MGEGCGVCCMLHIETLSQSLQSFAKRIPALSKLASVFAPTVALNSQNGATGARGNNEDKKTRAEAKQISEGELLLQVSTSPHLIEVYIIDLFLCLILYLKFMNC